MFAAYVYVRPVDTTALMVQAAMVAAVFVLSVGVAKLPATQRRLAVATLMALAIGTGLALAVPYHCDPIWKYLGLCGR